MTVKDFAQKVGISTAAVYKRIKSNGLDIASLKDPHTGELTPKGIEQLQALFGGCQPELTTELSTEVEKLTTKLNELSTQITELKAENDALKAENDILKEREKLLTDERDFLRKSLDQEQQLQALTLTKVPAPPALPAPDDTSGLPWYKRLFRKGGKES